MHIYLYVHANPVNNIDPSGKWTMVSTIARGKILASMVVNVGIRAIPAINRATVILWEAASGTSLYVGGAGSVIALRHGTKMGGVGWSTWQWVGNFFRNSGHKIGTYKELRKITQATGNQANHLNQFKAFEKGGAGIPKSDGVSVVMEGGTNSANTQHWKFHDVIEAFWDKARQRGRKTVSNAEYDKVMREALENAGFPPDEVKALAKLAEESRVSFKFHDGPGGLQPDVPGKIVMANP